MGSQTNSKFSIPDEYQQLLRQIEPEDNRSDADIIESLTRFTPVTSEKNIWGFWDKGVRHMPPWQQRNVCNWVRLHAGRDWTVRIIDTVPDSVTNSLHYIDKGVQPKAFVENEMTGGVNQHAAQHKADLLRSAVVHAHGGVWLDVGVAVLRNLDAVCWNRIMDPEDPAEVCAVHGASLSVLNGFVAARKGNPFLHKWHQLFAHLWEGRTDTDGMSMHPLIAPVLTLFANPPQEAESWEDKVPTEWNTDNQLVILDYVAQISCWVRTCMLIDATDGFNGPEYWGKKVALLHGYKDFWSIESRPGVGFKNGGAPTLKVLQTRLDAPKDSEEYQVAYKAVWNALSHASFQGAWHGKNLLKYPALGTLLDKAGDADCTPGTFAELLRYGATHFEQVQAPYFLPHNPEPTCVIERGVFEEGPVTRWTIEPPVAKDA